jgi:hypothetical protein
MSVMAATSAADTYMRAWGARAWIADPAEMPPPPATVRDMYLVHDAMKDHPLAESAFGGLAGWKLGAVGVIQGEPAISAPLFRQFVVDAPSGAVSAAAINMHNLEVTPEPRACMWGRAPSRASRCGSARVSLRLRRVPASARMTLVLDCDTTQAEVGVEMERDLGPKEDGTQYSTDEVAASRAHFVTSRVYTRHAQCAHLRAGPRSEAGVVLRG